MSMEHRAFVFDEEKFSKELRNLLLDAGLAEDVDKIKSFIAQHSDDIKSPYDGIKVNSDYEKGMYNKDVQEYADYAMTAYYEPDDDMGLSYAWEVVLKVLKKLKYKSAKYALLGKSVSKKGFCVDPGCSGLGIVAADDAQKIYEELAELEDSFNEDAENFEDEEFEADDIISAFGDLLVLYETATDEGCGLLLTF